jgi:hypothetical protein
MFQLLQLIVAAVVLCCCKCALLSCLCCSVWEGRARADGGAWLVGSLADRGVRGSVDDAIKGGAAALGRIFLWWTWQAAGRVGGAWLIEGPADWARGALRPYAWSKQKWTWGDDLSRTAWSDTTATSVRTLALGSYVRALAA